MMWIRRRELRHLTEHELVALSLHDEAASMRAGQHLRACEKCGRRMQDLIGFCGGVSRVVEDAAADALDPERLLAQRQRIARRLERIKEHPAPARVLRFPSCFWQGSSAPKRHRWIAAAALAGLLLGLAAGRVVYLPYGSADRIAARTAVPSGSPARPTAEARPPANELAEEAFLLEVEAALAASRVAELQAIDAMTPRILEAAVSSR